ncbi:MAG TPA: 2-oxoglutarate dehydrogenase complex dihydrolipoyllysine-residue succinyltransferase [Gemmatimonadaceae bacterium]|nr:2-oxoglutarate dehydrogenase complex dihydrolipoyllysine-residue succinyltransferase [Gemmatimonadaceae bacterium]
MLQLKVPPLGESIVEATISRWLKEEGDAVAAGETVLELDTDKITVEVAALRAGVLKSRAKNEGDVVKVDEVLGEIDDSATPAAGTPRQAVDQAPAAAGSTQTDSAPTSPADARAATAPKATAPNGDDVRPSPAAKRVAEERGVDLTTVQGTGRGGVISKPDVIEQTGAARATTTAEPPTAAPAAPAHSDGRGVERERGAVNQRERREKMSVRRKRIAERLLESQQSTAHLTTFNEIDMSAVVALRERLKERVEKEHGAKLSFMPFFVKASCMALKSFPVINAQVDGEFIVYKDYVHMGIAVASDDGLIVPVIRDADSKGMIQVSRDIVDIAKRARDRKLTMDDLTGGTFTITNGGVFGSLVSTPIINFPQVGILGLHKIQDRAVVIDGKVEVRPMMYVALSYDHRIVDGQQSVLFLVRLKELMEDPAAMLVE